MKRIILLISMITIASIEIFAQTGTYSGGGDGTSAVEAIQIATLADLIELSTTSADWNLYFIQTADIDASSTSTLNSPNGFSPIGNSTTNFQGNYNGQNFTISNLYINRSNWIGLFGYTTGATIKNLGMVNVSITGSSYVGGLVGFINSTTISNCYSSGNVSGSSDYVGGLVGYTFGYPGTSIISTSYSSANVSGADYVGGLVGAHYLSIIRNCYSTGDVTRNSVTATNFGAFCGENRESTIEYCYSLGSVFESTGILWDSDDGDETTGRNKGFVGANVGSYVVNTNNFFDSDVSNQTTGLGATAKTTSEMKSEATFTDATTIGLTTPVWDFGGNPNDDAANMNYWDIYPSINNGYPTLVLLPSLTTTSISNIGNTTAVSGGDITDNRGVLTEIGICWSTTTSPKITDSKQSNANTSDDPFTLSLSSLEPYQTYYVRAYAINSAGTTYGNEISFATIPTLGEWGLIALGSFFALGGGYFVWRRMIV